MASVSRLFPVATARGKHLFPFRTEQLSPSAPMVLGSQGPGRVGRRRFFLQSSVDLALRTSRPRAARTRLWTLRARCLSRERGLRADADLWRRCHGSAPDTACARAQPHTMRVLVPLTRTSLAGLVPVDLPVDVVVVLEQKERAGQGERLQGAPRDRGSEAGREHVFVKIGEPSDGRSEHMYVSVGSYLNRAF